MVNEHPFPLMTWSMLLLATLTFSACQHSEPDTDALDAFIDAWHQAASEADSATYFGSMAADGVFQGTDEMEYWTVDEFAAWSHMYFKRDEAWSFIPVERQFYTQGNTAWWAEKLDSDHMSRTRGNGVAMWEDGRWQIKHYALSFHVSNENADALKALEMMLEE